MRKLMCRAMFGIALMLISVAPYAAARTGSAATAQSDSPETCSISASEREDKASFSWSSGDCESGHQSCNNASSDNMPWSRLIGITASDLTHDGASIDARIKADAGEMRCLGTVHHGELKGSYTFTPNAEFAARLKALGIDGVRSGELQGYAMLDVSFAWITEMKDTGVTGMTSGNLLGLRALGVDPAYVKAMAAAGYPELHADQLTSMRAVGVTPEKVQAVRAMGFKPTQDELIQMSVFKIDAPFVERMRARGLKDLTIAKLVQIKVFKLDE